MNKSKGIDGYTGSIPVSLKPISYKSKAQLLESIEADIIFYEKQKDGIKIFIPKKLEEKLRK